MLKKFLRMLSDKSGATAIEYGLIAALIGVALITGAQTLGFKLDNAFSLISNTITNATGVD
ncbi:Flp family type IVb pilin [Rhizobium sp.]|uniref:Flp family type IVb pilin n=1 Tax=Rhizobium sp. TaxID=391 RepID=UPI000E9FAEA3|nr:Flp family type IVb pilin [Rhizobium sp.]